MPNLNDEWSLMQALSHFWNETGISYLIRDQRPRSTTPLCPRGNPCGPWGHFTSPPEIPPEGPCTHTPTSTHCRHPALATRVLLYSGALRCGPRKKAVTRGSPRPVGKRSTGLLPGRNEPVLRGVRCLLRVPRVCPHLLLQRELHRSEQLGDSGLNSS